MRPSLFTTVLLSVGSAACAGGSPDRPDPNDYPAAIDDSDIVPEANNCLSRTWPFEVEGRGWVDDTWEGIGEYTYQSTPDPITTITLRTCDGGLQPKTFTLSYRGPARVEPGEYVVTSLASTSSPGFRFSYTDTTLDGVEQQRCDDQPIGRVWIDRIDARRLRGRFDILAGCIDYDTISEALLPQDTWFRGWFEGDNVGRE